MAESYKIRVFTEDEVESTIAYLMTSHREFWITLLDRDVMNQSIEDISKDFSSALQNGPIKISMRETASLMGAIRSRNVRKFVFPKIGDSK